MRSALGLGTAIAVSKARESVSEELALDASADLLKRLRELHGRADRALTLLQNGRITREGRAELRVLVPSLKDEIGLEYKRLWPVRAQGRLSAEEGSFYWPAIAEVWDGLHLSGFRAHARPKRSWRKTLEEVDAKLTCYLQQLENQRGALRKSLTIRSEIPALNQGKS